MLHPLQLAQGHHPHHHPHWGRGWHHEGLSLQLGSCQLVDCCLQPLQVRILGKLRIFNTLLYLASSVVLIGDPLELGENLSGLVNDAVAQAIQHVLSRLAL